MSKNNEPGDAGVADKKSSTSNQKIVITVLIFIILVLSALLFYSAVKNKKEATKQLENPTVDTSEKSPAGTTNTTTDDNVTIEESTDSLGTDSTVPVADTVVKQADLYIVSYSFSESPKSGEEFKIWIKIGNKGNVGASSFHWEWWPTAYDSACSGEINSLAAGGTQTVECEYTYQSWSTYATKAKVDSKNEVGESNESNNIATKQVIPIHDEKVDLYITSYTFNHDPKQGEEFTVSITIKNKGDGDADEFWWEWWPTAYGKACREKINDLDPGESKTVKCDYTYGGWANYATKAVADADNDISESDEGNNTYTKNVIPIH